jgi:hypothetical protein
VRTTIEATVLVSGFLLGGSVGVGTVLYAVAIGPITHVTIPALAIRPRLRGFARWPASSPSTSVAPASSPSGAAGR